MQMDTAVLETEAMLFGCQPALALRGYISKAAGVGPSVHVGGVGSGTMVWAFEAIDEMLHAVYLS
jgi:hypothetical protein